MKPTLPSLQVFMQRDNTTLIAIETQLAELFQFTHFLGEFSPLLQDWFLASDTSKEDALLFEAFDKDGASTAALAVLRTELKAVKDIHTISLWNGADNSAESASIVSRNTILGPPDTISFKMKLRPDISDWTVPASWICEAVRIWPTKLVTFGPFWYDEKKVFKDRPGIGWMLYLPQILTTRQVPEARALMPVMSGDKKQLGTIIVSVTDEAFSDDNAEHVGIANAIEIRLVDQDLLPRYGEF
jgi:hypothetical protein